MCCMYEYGNMIAEKNDVSDLKCRNSVWWDTKWNLLGNFPTIFMKFKNFWPQIFVIETWSEIFF